MDAFIRTVVGIAEWQAKAEQGSSQTIAVLFDAMVRLGTTPGSITHEQDHRRRQLAGGAATAGRRLHGRRRRRGRRAPGHSAAQRRPGAQRFARGAGSNAIAPSHHRAQWHRVAQHTHLPPVRSNLPARPRHQPAPGARLRNRRDRRVRGRSRWSTRRPPSTRRTSRSPSSPSTEPSPRRPAAPSNSPAGDYDVAVFTLHDDDPSSANTLAEPDRVRPEVNTLHRAPGRCAAHRRAPARLLERDPRDRPTRADHLVGAHEPADAQRNVHRPGIKQPAPRGLSSSSGLNTARRTLLGTVGGARSVQTGRDRRRQSADCHSDLLVWTSCQVA